MLTTLSSDRHNQDLANLNMLPLYRDRNAMGIILEEEDEEKPQILISWCRPKCLASASWLRYFDEGEVTQSVLALEALLSYWLLWFEQLCVFLRH